MAAMTFFLNFRCHGCNKKLLKFASEIWYQSHLEHKHTLCTKYRLKLKNCKRGHVAKLCGCIRQIQQTHSIYTSHTFYTDSDSNSNRKIDMYITL